MIFSSEKKNQSKLAKKEENLNLRLLTNLT